MWSLSHFLPSVSPLQHVYDDKYGLAEFLANTAIAAGHECLAQLGLTAAGMQQLVAWGRDRSVTLRFEGTETCQYLREVSRKVESASTVHESTLFGKSSSKVVTTVRTQHTTRTEAEAAAAAAEAAA
jgi:hypothetical protein